MTAIKRVVMDHIRKNTDRSNPEPCHICGKYQEIAHQHHLYPVAKLAQWAIDNNWLARPFRIPVVWLCPNHHAMFHALVRKKPILSLWGDLSDGETERMESLILEYDRLTYGHEYDRIVIADNGD